MPPKISVVIPHRENLCISSPASCIWSPIVLNDRNRSRRTNTGNMRHLWPPQFRKVGVEYSLKFILLPTVAPPGEHTMWPMQDFF